MKKKAVVIGVAVAVAAAGVYFGLIKDYQKERLLEIGYTEEEIELLRAELEPEVVKQLEGRAKFDFRPDRVRQIGYVVQNGITEPYTELMADLLEQEYFVLGRLERYLTYAGEEYEAATVVRHVNADLDHEFYYEAAPVDATKDLVLVNKHYYFDEAYEPEDLVEIAMEYSNEPGEYVQETVYEAFRQMVEAAALDGLAIRNNSAYRSYATQAWLYNNYSTNNGFEYAEIYSARPGFSEHQAGVALDLGVPSDQVVSAFEYTAEFQWLLENAARFGFILRYPEGKEYITGYHYEPWHYRYVGMEAANYIREHDLTFEEYYAYFVQ